MTEERWLPVVGFEGRYEVSDLGRVRSIDRTVYALNRWEQLKGRKCKGQLLSPGHTRKYLQVKLSSCMRNVHGIVLRAFVGPRPTGKQAAHLDGNPENNKIQNLVWKTPKENFMDKEIHGTVLRNLQHPNAKLSECEVSEIRTAVRSGEKRSAIAQKYKISKGHVGQIICGGRRASV